MGAEFIPDVLREFGLKELLPPFLNEANKKASPQASQPRVGSPGTPEPSNPRATTATNERANA